MRFRQQVRQPTVVRQPARNEPPPGWHDGTLAAVHIVRRQSDDYQRAGWDLVDTHSNILIQEFYDDELTDMFKSMYNICYNNTIEMLKLFGAATPEHEYSETGTPIAMIRFEGYTTLPQTMGMNKKQAMDARSVNDYNTRKIDTDINATKRMTASDPF
jgi:hypothetical protein